MTTMKVIIDGEEQERETERTSVQIGALGGPETWRPRDVPVTYAGERVVWQIGGPPIIIKVKEC